MAQRRAMAVCLVCFGWKMSCVASASAERADAPAERAEAAVLGAMVADAAAMPLHWLYDPDDIRRLLQAAGREGQPEFFPVPSSPFYKAAVGTQSPYGNQTLVLLRSLAGSWPGAGVDGFLAAYAEQNFAEFQNFAAHAWTDASTRGFVKNYAAGLRWPACGAQDNQANALAHMVPAVAATWCWNEGDALDLVEKVIRTTQNTDEAAAFGTAGARILRRLIMGQSVAQAVNHTVVALMTTKERLPCCDGYFADRLSEVFRVREGITHYQAVNLIGSSCMYPQNLISGAHLLSSGQTDFVEGIRSTILAAGDQASRGMFLGAALGAAAGSPEMIPWSTQADSAEEVQALAKRIVSSCSTRSWQFREQVHI